MSNHTDPCPSHAAFILFCSFSATNSVLYCAEHFAPVPLYKVGRTSGEDFESLVRWQLQYQALDEIQMQEKRVLFKSAEQSVQGFYSALNQQGYQQAKTLSKELNKPVYYYLYSGSSADWRFGYREKMPLLWAPTGNLLKAGMVCLIFAVSLASCCPISPLIVSLKLSSKT